MKFVALLTFSLVGLTQLVCAQDAGERYHAKFRSLGFMMRATYACPIDKRQALKRVGDSATAESRAFAQAFPQTVQRWAEEGAGIFNASVMKSGLSETCAAVR